MEFEYKPLKLDNVPIIEQIYSLHYFEYTKDFVFPGESHNFWELVYVDAGDVIVTAGNKEFTMKTGQMFIHKPMEFHNIRCGSTTTSNSIIISFSSNERNLYGIAGSIICADDGVTNILHRIISETKTSFISPLGESYLNELVPTNDPPYGSRRLIIVNIEELLIKLIRSHCDTSNIPKINQVSQSERMFSDICRYIEEHHADKLYLADICEKFSISPSALKKIFSAKAGMGAIDYCINCRISHAKNLILSGGMFYSDIAAISGFSSVHYFSKAFKKHTGMSPKEYAKHARGSITTVNDSKINNQ